VSPMRIGVCLRKKKKNSACVAGNKITRKKIRGSDRLACVAVTEESNVCRSSEEDDPCVGSIRS